MCRSVSGSFVFLCGASCRVSGSDRGASFQLKFKCWCTWNVSDSSQMKRTKQEVKNTFSEEKEWQYVIKSVSALSSACFYSRWITLIKCFPYLTVMWYEGKKCIAILKCSLSFVSVYCKWMHRNILTRHVIRYNLLSASKTT